MVSWHRERRTNRSAAAWAALALGAGVALTASGCGGRVGRVHQEGGSGRSAAEGGLGSGATAPNDDDDDDGAAHSGTNGAGGRSAGSGGATGQAGSGGATGQAGSGEHGSTAAARTGFAVVAGGTLMRSKSYVLVLSAGESPGNNGILHSSSSKSYRMVGGLVGVTTR